MEDKKLRIAFVGLGKMGGSMVRRLSRASFPVLGFDPFEATREALRADGIDVVATLQEIPKKFQAGERRIVWVMVPAGDPVDDVIKELAPALSPGDIIIDGGNSRFTDTIRRHVGLKALGIHLVDVGTSGGLKGFEHGYCLMIGGEKEPVEYLVPVFKALAAADGYLHDGASGGGHYAKMVHNGIEYAVMQSLGEGFDLLASCPYDFDLAALSGLWNRGSVLRSWLLELLQNALKDDGRLEDIVGYVEDSGEGRWTVEESIVRSVPTPTIALALYGRFRSRREDSFTDKVVAALRKQFGGRAVKKKGGQ